MKLELSLKDFEHMAEYLHGYIGEITQGRNWHRRNAERLAKIIDKELNEHKKHYPKFSARFDGKEQIRALRSKF